MEWQVSWISWSSGKLHLLAHAADVEREMLRVQPAHLAASSPVGVEWWRHRDFPELIYCKLNSSTVNWTTYIKGEIYNCLSFSGILFFSCVLCTYMYLKNGGGVFIYLWRIFLPYCDIWKMQIWQVYSCWL